MDRIQSKKQETSTNPSSEEYKNVVGCTQSTKQETSTTPSSEESKSVVGCTQSTKQETSTTPSSEERKSVVGCTQSTKQETSTTPSSEERKNVIGSAQSTKQATSTFISSEERQKFRNYISSIGKLYESCHNCERVIRGSPKAKALTKAMHDVKRELVENNIETKYPGQFFSSKLDGQFQIFIEV